MRRIRRVPIGPAACPGDIGIRFPSTSVVSDGRRLAGVFGIVPRVPRLVALVALAVGAWPGIGALAQLPSPRNPVQENAPRPPPRLSPGLQGPPILEQQGPGAAAEVAIGTVRITDNTAVSEAVLQDAVQGLAGATVSLARIEEVRIDILRRYRDAGFTFASVNAGLSPREDGSVDLIFQLVEGFIAEVKLDGDIGPAGTQALRFLNQLLDQRPISALAIERALLLVSDIPGVTVRGTLRPLDTLPGALQLIARVERRSYSGYVTVDNRGYRLVGPYQGLFVVGANSFSEFGERTELAVFGAQDSTQWFVQGSVEAFLGGSGLRARLYGGGGDTRPSGSLRDLGYYGQTQVGGGSLTYPLVRSRAANVLLTGAFDLFDGEIETGTEGRDRASRDSVRTLRLGADAQMLDSGLIAALPAATNLGSLRVHQGLDVLGATSDGAPRSSRSGNETFSFTKITGEIQRTQPIFEPFDGGMVNLQGLFAGQYTNDIVPQPEKCYLGGGRLGRGFYSGQVTGDTCWSYAIELQLDTLWTLPPELQIASDRLSAQFYLFRDYARAYENLETDPNRNLSSFGAGVRTVFSETVQLDLEGVRRISRRPDGSAEAKPLKEDAFFARILVRF